MGRKACQVKPFKISPLLRSNEMKTHKPYSLLTAQQPATLEVSVALKLTGSSFPVVLKNSQIQKLRGSPLGAEVGACLKGQMCCIRSRCSLV